MSISNIFNKKTSLIISFILIAELVSLLGYYLPPINKLAFIALALTALIVSLIRFEFGLLILLAELFIGSKGYLFYFEIGSLTISIRLALWLIVMAVWLGQTVIKLIKNKKPEINFTKSNYFYYYLIFFIFILWGLINGFLNHNAFSNIFFDFNGWLYFALIFPIYGAVKSEKSIINILGIFFASVIWLSFKTIFLLYIFSHNLNGLAIDLYRWVRLTGVGEITQIQGGFYRIFMQSQIYLLIAFFIILFFAAYAINNSEIRKSIKNLFFAAALLAWLLAALIISFSRSFWLGLAAGIFIFWLAWLIEYGRTWKKWLYANFLILLALAISLILILIIVKFPLPKPVGGFNAADLLTDRASQFTGEAAAASRWSLLPELWLSLSSAPILGRGFGSTVTYYTYDPRQVNSSQAGVYTAYAFEWGWLDIWLKLGLFGLLFYIALLVKIAKPLFAKNHFINQNELALSSGLMAGIIIIFIISLFSPYTNHPLGIGYIILTSVILDCYNKRPGYLHN